MGVKLVCAVTIALLIAGQRCTFAVANLVLTSEPSSTSGSFCGGPVVFTCRATEISIIFEWQLNGTDISTYSFDPDHTYPLDVVTSPVLAPTVAVEILNALPTAGNSINITSTLNVSNISILNGSSLLCADRVGAESNTVNIDVNALVPAPPPSPNCSIATSSGDPVVTLLWSDDFNNNHVVGGYNVQVNHDPSSCSSDQVSPSEEYSCSGLELGTNYSITFNAINCGNQEGDPRTLSVLLQAPDVPREVTTTTEDDAIGLEWTEVPVPAVSLNCTFNRTISYVVVLEDNSGMTVEERGLNSDTCSAGLCSTTFNSRNQYCRVGVSASNVFGNSPIAYANIGAARLTLPNRVLLGLGGALLGVAMALMLLLIGMEINRRKGSKLFPFLLLLVCGAVLIMVSLVFWVTVGLQVGLQDNICDPDWQATRDGLIIFSFVLSGVSFFVTVAAFVLFLLIFMNKFSSPTKEARFDEYELAPKHGAVAGESELELVQEFKKYGQKPLVARSEKEEQHLQRYNPVDPEISAQMTMVCDPGVEVDVPGKDAKPNQGHLDAQNEGQSKEKGEGQKSKNKREQAPDKPSLSEEEKMKQQQEGVRDTTETEQTEYATTVHFPAVVQVVLHPMETIYSYMARGSESDAEYDIPNQGRSGEGSGKATSMPPCDSVYSSLEKYPCSTMWNYNRYLLQVSEKSPTKPLRLDAAFWLPDNARWSTEDLSPGHPLIFHLLNSCPSNWNYGGHVIDAEWIEHLLNDTWNDCFTPGPRQNSHIRVYFEGDRCNCSLMGCLAEWVKKETPTMIFNFSGMKNEEIKATIVHQFGHALGLGHALMEPHDWTVIKDYVHVDEMMKSFGSQNEEDFDLLWTGNGIPDDVVNYDDSSVMQYSTTRVWWREKIGVKEVAVKNSLGTFKKHETAQKTYLSPKDIDARECLLRGISRMIKKDLLALTGDKGSKFNLTEELSFAWRIIGKKLGIVDDVLDSIERAFETDSLRLDMVWNNWFNHPSYQKIYSTAWDELFRLLTDIEQTEVARIYRDFLVNNKTISYK